MTERAAPPPGMCYGVAGGGRMGDWLSCVGAGSSRPIVL